MTSCPIVMTLGGPPRAQRIGHEVNGRVGCMKLSNEIWPDNPYREMGIVGVSQNSWGQKPIEWCVDRCAEFGYDGVDFFYDRFLDFEPAEYDRLAATLGDYIHGKGLEVASIGAHHLTVAPRAWERAAQMEIMKKAIDLAAQIKARTVVAYIAGYYNPPTYKMMSRKEATIYQMKQFIAGIPV